MNTLHIYSQESWHDDTYIVGDKRALTQLRDNLTAAIESGQGQKFDSFTADGEGFSVKVIPDNLIPTGKLREKEEKWCRFHGGSPRINPMDAVRLPYHGEIALDRDPDRLWPWELPSVSDSSLTLNPTTHTTAASTPNLKLPAGKYLIVSAAVRYWEDATVNGIKDELGALIPFRNGNLWCPIIDLNAGTILNWPRETTAKIHYKVCDEGEYWILTISEPDSDGNRTESWFKYADWYVPDCFLCHGRDRGFGDYIIMDVNGDGAIQDFAIPRQILGRKLAEWPPCDSPPDVPFYLYHTTCWGIYQNTAGLSIQ